MSDLMRRQSSDAANASGVGTTQLSENQGQYQKAASVQDGGASGKGKTEPALDTGTR